MEKGLSAEETQVANAAAMQNLERLRESVSINPAQAVALYFAIGKIAEIAGRVASIGDSNIAKSRTTATDEPQHIRPFGQPCRQSHLGS